MLCSLPRALLTHHKSPRALLQHPTNRALFHKKHTKIPTLNVFRVSISPTHQLSHSADNILKDPSHVLQATVRQRYGAIIRGRYDEFEEGLWMTFTSNPLQRKKVVRSWVRRRIAEAVKGELRVRGFNARGRRINSGEATVILEDDAGDSRKPDALVGTVDVEAMNLSVETPFAEVQRQAGLVVEEILRVCGRRIGHSRY